MRIIFPILVLALGLAATAGAQNTLAPEPNPRAARLPEQFDDGAAAHPPPSENDAGRVAASGASYRQVTPLAGSPTPLDLVRELSIPGRAGVVGQVADGRMGE